MTSSANSSSPMVSVYDEPSDVRFRNSCTTADVVPGGLETVLNPQPKNWAGTRPARKDDRYV